MTVQALQSDESAPFSWVFVWFMVFVHVGALFSFFTFSWSALALTVFLHWITGGVGVTLCYHRLLTHRSFTVPRPLEYFLALLGTLSMQGGPIMWVAHHRIHHAHSDTSKDPHDSSKGFWWSHMGWMFFQPKDRMDYDLYSRHAKDLARDPVHRFLNRYMLHLQILFGLGLYLIGGWSFVIYGIFVRLVLVYHTTWLVNSACHMWGYRSYETDDRSTNLWWSALLTYGEGWHNNHHAMPRSARHGLRWWEVDMTYWVIWTLARLGLARDLHLPTRP
ncbi:MAG: fatty acid desaturase [Gemmatimonadaceae bacterium]|nr:fatty acid desaturase [Gloeobacterales cyanobacterium ES-bin-141]